MVLKYTNSKQKRFEIYAPQLWLGSASKFFSVDNMKETRLCGYVYDFPVNFDNNDVDIVLVNHIYLMKYHTISRHQQQINSK